MLLVPLLPVAPPFALKTAEGGLETIAPAKDRKATVVIVVLAECPIVRQYSPELIRIAKTYSGKGVRFVMAFSDGSPKAWKAQLSEFGLPFVAARGDRSFIRRLGATAVPTAAVVTSDGTISYVGRIDDRYPSLGVQREVRRHDLRLALDDVLAHRPVRLARTTVVGCALPNG